MRLAGRCGVGARLRASPLINCRARALSTPAPAAHQPPPAGALAAAPAAAGILQLPGMYLELSKAKLSGLVVLTTAAGHLMAQAPLDPALLTATLGGTFLCAASANTLNQVIEAPRDARMARTARRPLPSGRMSRPHALAFGGMAGLGGVGTLAVMVDPLTAALGAGTIALYAGVYTPLKPLTPYNTWVGAAVGAVPPLMGWASAGAPLFTPEAFVLSSALFLWQIPHFLALAWMYRADYAAGGYAMLPRFDPTGARTARVSLEYTAYLAALPVGCWAGGITSCMFPIEGILFNGAMLAAALRFRRASHLQPAQQTIHARRLFFISLAYLPFFFFCLLLHQHHRNPASATLAAPLAYPPFSDALPDTAGGAGPHTVGGLAAEARGRLRERGRRLCVHEHMEAPAMLCPVAAADTVVTKVEGGLGGAVGAVGGAVAVAEAGAAGCTQAVQTAAAPGGQ